MHIKEISIDGFKSYAQRVVIPGFDSQFNAITGLNGSGKSNILDSICFVLGIQNLQQVRANSLQELVYKQGQAGITKATVSIVFDNQDKDRSPVGYDHLDEITVTRQLVIGGRSKYLINGKVAEPTRVQNLFHSVQLNVNNPHFLIMQGRITKVLNMKPPEILGLLEEAAGTKMYESKKQSALRTLEKKQVKVDEINKVLMLDIMPALDKLRKEKVQYMEWQNATTSLDRLRRFCVAYRYVEAESLQKNGAEQVKAVEGSLSDLDAQEAALDLQIREQEDEIQGLQTEKELQSDGEARELLQQVDDLSKRLVKETSSWNNKKELLEAEGASIKQLEASLAELDRDGLQERIQAATAARDEARQAFDAALAGIDAAQNELAGAEAGDGRDASNRSMQERLEDAQNKLTEAEAEAKAAQARSKHLQKQLSEQKKAYAAKEKEGSHLLKELTKAQAAVDKLRQSLAALGHDSVAIEQLEAAVSTERNDVQRWKDRVDELSAHLSAIDFQYSDPEHGFDRSRVKGVVAKLVQVADPATSTALEVAAGGKLYQVVVDSEQTAKALLSRGQLRNRVTIIPLNKVTGRDIPAPVVSAARKLAGDKVQPAMELVGYNQELAAAMKYVFGGAFVCKDAGTAKKLAFSREVNTRCINLEGDDFNPGGTLTGGSRNRGSSVLARLHELATADAELRTHQAALQQASTALQAQMTSAAEYGRVSKQIELQEHALALLEEQMQGSEVHRLGQAVAASTHVLEEADSALQASLAKQQEMKAAVKQLQQDIANFSTQRDKHVKASQSKLKAAKQALEAAKKQLKAMESSLQACVAEADAAEGERTTLQSQLQTTQQTAAQLEAQVAQLAAVVASTKAEYDQMSEKLEERRARLRQCDDDIAEASRALTELQGQKTNLTVERKKLNHRQDALRKDMAEAGTKCQKLEAEYPWIPSERPHFGRPGGDYDWQASDPAQAFAEHERASATIDSLSRKVNKKVMQMFEKAEQEYTELKRKKEVVEGDKRKIQEVMGELDDKKREALERTWRQVNVDFGAIFSTLLPGTTAKLEPQEGCSFMDGLEVRVAFGGVWKESLSELSGGQKSLLALSLILAMLRFKPAPIYILDEVDAALDLSHTQNIGRMIKAHFPQSQFIVVSLKEGMFSNANVIFRTKFVDGVSTVSRTVNQIRAAAGSAAGGSKAGGSQQLSRRPALQENVGR